MAPSLPNVKANVNIKKLGQTQGSRFGTNRDAKVRGPKDVRDEKAGL